MLPYFTTLDLSQNKLDYRAVTLLGEALARPGLGGDGTGTHPPRVLGLQRLSLSRNWQLLAVVAAGARRSPNRCCHRCRC
jgi:hypothetical protein